MGKRKGSPIAPPTTAPRKQERVKEDLCLHQVRCRQVGMEMRIQSRPGSSGAKLLPVGRQGGIYQVAQFYGDIDQWKELLGDGRCHPYG